MKRGQDEILMEKQSKRGARDGRIEIKGKNRDRERERVTETDQQLALSLSGLQRQDVREVKSLTDHV